MPLTAQKNTVLVTFYQSKHAKYQPLVQGDLTSETNVPGVLPSIGKKGSIFYFVNKKMENRKSDFKISIFQFFSKTEN